MEGFLALLDYYAVSCKVAFLYCMVNGGYLVVSYEYAALLNETSCFALGCAERGLEHHVDKRNLSVCEVFGGECCCGHMLGIYSALSEQRLCACLSLFSFFFAVNHLGKLIREDFLSCV